MKKRIIATRTVKAGDLKPHPLNWRTHPETQKTAVTALYDEVGEVRSLSVYIADADKPQGWAEWKEAERRKYVARCAPSSFTIVDGHGRRSWLPDEQLEVEILDLADDEARKVLLSLDATAALAGRDEQALDSLLAITQADNAALQAMWESLAARDEEVTPVTDERTGPDVPEQYLVLVTCSNEQHQARLLKRFHDEGLKCKALTG